jgi:hypothetical protein
MNNIINSYKEKDPLLSYAEACYCIEKELHCRITSDYPVNKFMAQLKMMEREAKEMKKRQKTKTVG